MKEIENELRKQVEEQHTPSIQYAFFNQDHVLHRYSFGLADVKNAMEADAKTTYHGFSTTKTFTAVAILQLADLGLLDIHDAVINYLPDFHYAPSTTIRHLLTHTAGIPNPVPLSWIHSLSEHESFDSHQFFKAIMAKNKKVKSAPNERFAYSNLGYILLGQVIEKVTGQSYEDYITSHIISTLGLGPDQLGFQIYNSRRHATGYHKQKSFSNLILGLFLDKSKFMGEAEEGWKPFKDYYVNGAPYGGLIGNADAYVKYVQDLLRPDSVLIRPANKKSLFEENKTNNGKATGMCLSWYTGLLHGHRYCHHAGGGGGYYCEIRIYPDRGLGSVVMFNRTGMTDERFLDKVDQRLIL